MTPSVCTLEKLATALGIGLGDIFTEPEYVPDPFTQELLRLLAQIPEPRRRRALHTLAILAGTSDPLPGSFRSIGKKISNAA